MFIDNDPLNAYDNFGQSKNSAKSIALAAQIMYAVVTGTVSLYDADGFKGWADFNVGDEGAEDLERVLRGQFGPDVKTHNHGKPYPPFGSKTGNGMASRLAGRISPAQGRFIRGVGNGFKKVGVGAGILALADVATAESFANNLSDWARNVAKGDDAMATLDAVSAAIDLQTLGGDYFATMTFLGMLLEAGE